MWRDRWLTAGVAGLLLILPWHEFLVLGWRPLGAWKELVLAGFLLLLIGAPCQPTRLLLPVLAVWVVTAVSALVNGVPLWSARYCVWLVAGLAASQLPSRAVVERLCRLLLMVGVVAALHGLLSFAAFQAVGGGPRLRPPVENPLVQALVYPYYCGVYPRGWRLVGGFLNDNYFGDWMAALICLALAQPTRPRGATIPGLVLLGAAWALTFSRGAFVALLGGLAFLAWRLSPRVALVFPLAVLLALPVAKSHDLYRFQHPLATEGGRLNALRKAGQVLMERPFLGCGPSRGGAGDIQYAKTAADLGGLGLAAWGWLAVAALIPAWRREVEGESPEQRALRFGLGAALICFAGGALGGDVLEVPQTALYMAVLAGMLSRLEAPVRAG